MANGWCERLRHRHRQGAGRHVLHGRASTQSRDTNLLQLYLLGEHAGAIERCLPILHVLSRVCRQLQLLQVLVDVPADWCFAHTITYSDTRELHSRLENKTRSSTIQYKYNTYHIQYNKRGTIQLKRQQPKRIYPLRWTHGICGRTANWNIYQRLPKAKKK